jgi:hypothetical protein
MRDGGAREAPPWPQHLNWGRLANPHVGNGAVKGTPHSPENFRPSGSSKPQLGQRIATASWTAVSAVGARVHRFPPRCPHTLDARWCVSTPASVPCQVKTTHRLRERSDAPVAVGTRATSSAKGECGEVDDVREIGRI